MTLTKEERIACHRRFMGSNWELIAAFAWEQYLAKGRGAVVVPEDDFVSAEEPHYARIRFTYMTNGSDLARELGRAIGEKELGWIRTYDPDQKAVLIVLRPEGGTSSYLIGGGARPSECHARAKARSN